ncbi:hypothetical protein [Cytobacillus sp. IB215665]|uniref:ABC transporter permease n=1 Tax=Cytobacillus sp. IB215665 TaxID=3097357 RepID=UPI002A0DB34A|nr:hypothetical protein [Cytobacillus sp. IB215665]MDX8363621.1 hypothetical protein [Cytobacillus sp. IB215665]
MNNFIVLSKKEFVQMLRDYKLIWLPLIFIVLGITQPVVTLFLPSIIGSLGGETGITIDPSIYTQSGGEVLASTFGSQFDQLGLIILIISTMGIIHTDKVNGMLAFILTRPVNIISYISGKIIPNFLMASFGVLLGFFVSYLYVIYLFTHVSFSRMIIAMLFYLVWVLFIVTFTTMISTIFNSQGIIAILSIAFLLGCRMILGLNPSMDFVNPAIMSKNGMEVLTTGSISSSAAGNLFVTLIWVALILFVINYWISNKKYINR